MRACVRVCLRVASWIANRAADCDLEPSNFEQSGERGSGAVTMENKTEKKKQRSRGRKREKGAVFTLQTQDQPEIGSSSLHPCVVVVSMKFPKTRISEVDNRQREARRTVADPSGIPTPTDNLFSILGLILLGLFSWCTLPARIDGGWWKCILSLRPSMWPIFTTTRLPLRSGRQSELD